MEKLRGLGGFEREMKGLRWIERRFYGEIGMNKINWGWKHAEIRS